jgi:GNAT superfamily N-acetyltransferase
VLERRVLGLDFSVVDANSSAARWALSRYFAELEERFTEGFDGDGALVDAGDVLNPPKGLFVLAGPVDTPLACGGISYVDAERGEVKRMWVDPSARGHGVATRLLQYLETLIADTGRSYVVLDTNSVLAEAIALYRRSGYQPIERYNDNPYAHLWFGKVLSPTVV